MNDGRWTVFGFVNYLLLAFYIYLLLTMFSASAHAADTNFPLLIELLFLSTPVAGIINCLFNRSIIRRNFHPHVPLSDRKKNWQLIISLLHFAAYVFIIYLLLYAIRIEKQIGEENNDSFQNFFKVILLIYGILSIYVSIFQLVVARNTGSIAEDSDPESEAIAQEDEE